MNGTPQKLIRIAADDYISGLRGLISAETLGRVTDELTKARVLPNMLKDESKRIRYDARNDQQHIFITDPSHEVKVIKISEEIL